MKTLPKVIILVGIILVLVYGAQFVTTVLPDIARYFLNKADTVHIPFPEEVPDEEGQGATTLPLTLPSNFSISVFAEGLEKPRVLVREPGGNLAVSLLQSGEVVALPDRNYDGVADETAVILAGLNRPHGILFRCDTKESGERGQCYLYVAEEGALSEYRYDPARLVAENRRVILELPTRGGGHYTRTLSEEPGTDRLLISVGSSCNVCQEEDERRASILAVDATSGEYEVYARGLRNAVFMATHPVTGDVWATENGRDWLGDDLPPDEINIVYEGQNYGWPICYGKNVHDTDFDTNTYIRNPCEEPFETPSWIDVAAHSAPLGLAFIPEEGWPEEYWYDLIVAYHGSWNRSEPTGYKLVRFMLDEEGNVEGQEDFISGWLTERGGVIGRPVAVYIEPGGIMYVTDDQSGVVYRVVYQP